MSEPPLSSPTRSNEFFKTIRLALVIAAVLFGGWFALIRPAESVADRTLDTLSTALAKITNQKTTIVEGRAEVIEVSDVAELSLVKVKMSTVRSMEDESYALSFIPLGRKSLQVRGTFLVTAGYDLSSGSQLLMSADGSEVIADFPEPKILGVELVDYETLNAESGWRNKLTDQDRDEIVRVLRHQMRKEAEVSGLRELSAQYLETRLRDLTGAQTVQLNQLP